MKNSITINGLAITIEGCPVQLDHVELTSEVSAQELATSGGLIKALVGELKPLITEAVKPVATPAVTTTAQTPTNNYNNYSNNYKSNNYNKNDNTRTLEIQQKFDALIRPAELTEGKSRSWVYEYGSYNDGDRIKVNIDNTKFGVLHVNIMTCYLQVHIHVYPDKTTWHGASSATFCQLLKHIGMPATIQEYLMKVVAL